MFSTKCDMNKYVCDKCFCKAESENIIIKNNKLVCPLCGHTLETDKFKTQEVRNVQEKKKEEVSYEDKSTDK
jgi:uncharacterized Zn finger protein (UPF0148 family)